MLLILFFGFLWITAISLSTIYASKVRKNDSTEIMKTIVTKNVVFPPESFFSWIKEENIEVDYKGMLE